MTWRECTRALIKSQDSGGRLSPCPLALAPLQLAVPAAPGTNDTKGTDTMAERSEYPAGTFCWVDLATTDQEAAKSFYGDLFGWSYEDVPTDVGNTYSLATIETKQVAAIYPLPGEGMPPHWVSYVSVPSADEAAKRAADLGGTLINESISTAAGAQHGQKLKSSRSLA